MNVLLCEDDVELLHIIEFTLKRCPEWKISTAKDGKDAIDKLREESFDLVITDVSMPFYSGIDLARFVAATQTATTSFIIISDDVVEDTMCEAKRLGAIEYIFKPFSPLELFDHIKRFYENQFIKCHN